MVYHQHEDDFTEAPPSLKMNSPFSIKYNTMLTLDMQTDHYDVGVRPPTELYTGNGQEIKTSPITLHTIIMQVSASHFKIILGFFTFGFSLFRTMCYKKSTIQAFVSSR